MHKKGLILGIVSILVGLVASQDYCNPSPCGANTNCETINGRPVCSCKEDYTGNAITGCSHECESDNQCSTNQACIKYRCKDPCVGGCGDYADCEVRNHKAICSCPEEFGGDAYTKCLPECQRKEDCPSHLSCLKYHCGNPCIEDPPCKANTQCKVRKHVVECTCKVGFIGDPLTTGCYRAG